MTSQPGKQTITVHILPNISRCKGNHTMRFIQLIECNVRKIIYAKNGGELFPDPFLKN